MRVLGLVDVPRAVGVDADAALDAERRTHRGDAGDVVGEPLPGLGDLDLGGAASVEAGQHLGDGCRGHRRHGGVHGDLAPQRRGLRHPPEVDRRGEPRGGLVVVVLDERRELRPALRPLEQHGLAHVDAAEPRRERERDDARRREQLVEGEGCRGVVAHALHHALFGTAVQTRVTPSRPSSGRTTRSQRKPYGGSSIDAAPRSSRSMRPGPSRSDRANGIRIVGEPDRRLDGDIREVVQRDEPSDIGA